MLIYNTRFGWGLLLEHEDTAVTETDKESGRAGGKAQIARPGCARTGRGDRAGEAAVPPH